MDLKEIIKDLEDTIDYFKEPNTEFQMGRRFQAKDTLEQLLAIPDVYGLFCGRVTEKMKEARKTVDDYIKENGFSPSYRTVAKLMGIKSTAVYHRLRGYRHMMVRRQR